MKKSIGSMVLLFVLLMVLVISGCVPVPTPAPTSTPVSSTFTPEPTATQTPLPTPTITPTPTRIGGGSGRFIFRYGKDEFLTAFPDLKGEANVFVANIDGTNLTPITNGLEGINCLMDVSPDGSKVLITSTSNFRSREANLYLVNLDSPESEPIKLADGLPNYYGENSSAKWINDAEIIYIGKGESGFGIYRINSDGTNLTNIYKYNGDGNKPFEILALSGENVYWDTQRTTRLSSIAVSNKYYVWQSGLDGGERAPLEVNGKQLTFDNVFGPDLVFSPDGSKIAWVDGATGPDDPYPYLHIAPISDINNPYTIQTLTAFVVLKWLDGSKVLVFDIGSADTPIEEFETYYSKNPDKPLASSFKDLYGVYEISVSENPSIKNYGFSAEIMGSISGVPTMELYDISPDGRQIVLSTYKKNDKGGYDTVLKLFNLETLTFSDLSGFAFASTVYGIHGLDIHWIP